MRYNRNLNHHCVMMSQQDKLIIAFRVRIRLVCSSEGGNSCCESWIMKVTINSTLFVWVCGVFREPATDGHQLVCSSVSLLHNVCLSISGHKGELWNCCHWNIWFSCKSVWTGWWWCKLLPSSQLVFSPSLVEKTGLTCTIVPLLCLARVWATYLTGRCRKNIRTFIKTAEHRCR